jgi:Fic family protein
MNNIEEYLKNIDWQDVEQSLAKHDIDKMLTDYKGTLPDKELEFLIHSNLIENVKDEGLKDSIKAWKYAKTIKILTRESLLEIHRLLLQNLDPDIAGKFRECNVKVGNRICPDWEVIDYEIDGIIDSFNWSPCYCGADVNSVEAWTKNTHIDFEKLHCHTDGNGRTGRILMNWQRLKLGLDIITIKYEDRWNYYEWFKD